MIFVLDFSSSALVCASCGSRAASALVNVYIASINSFDDVNAWRSPNAFRWCNNMVRLPVRAHTIFLLTALWETNTLLAGLELYMIYMRTPRTGSAWVQNVGMR